MDHRRSTMTAAIGRVGLLQLLNHFAHFADRQEVVSFDGGFTGHVRQRVFFPCLAMAGVSIAPAPSGPPAVRAASEHSSA